MHGFVSLNVYWADGSRCGPSAEKLSPIFSVLSGRPFYYVYLANHLDGIVKSQLLHFLAFHSPGGMRKMI